MAGKKRSPWKATSLDLALSFGLDPRRAANAYPILNILKSAIFDLPDNIPPEVEDALERLLFVEKAQLIGPKFTCPYCQGLLIHPPVRSFVLEDLLATLPEMVGEQESANNDRGSSSKEKGKTKEQSDEVKAIDWSEFFGQSLRQGAYGH